MIKTKLYCYIMFRAFSSSSSKMIPSGFITTSRMRTTTPITTPQIRQVALPPYRGQQQSGENTSTKLQKSVTGTIYTASNTNEDDSSRIVVKLFTKEGCTLCDKVKDVLTSIKEDEPHTLEAVDITDPEHEMWWSKYKYDIPILHINDKYWVKHRLDEAQAKEGLQQARDGTFVEQSGDPDAGAMEAKQAEREQTE